MTFPIYNCGKIQFRDGVPAISTRCCCWLIPCCSDCYFPVANRAQDVPQFGSEGGQVGGPSTITGFYTQRIDTKEGETEPWTKLTWSQNGESIHGISKGFISIDPDCDYLILRSRCFWAVPVHFTYELYGVVTNEFDINILVTYSSTSGWIAVPDGGTALTPDSWNQFGCSGTFPWSFANTRYEPSPAPGFNVDATVEGTFTAGGGKAWPDGFVCGGHSSREGLFNVAENRLAVTTDFPDGWFD